MPHINGQEAEDLPVGWTVLTPIERTQEETAALEAVCWFDIDNCLYSKSRGIAPIMSKKIHDYFVQMGYPEDEAWELHLHYYKNYGLAIRGLQAHHPGFDVEDFDKKCDGALPLEDLLENDEQLQSLLRAFNRKKVKVMALTNANKPHALRVLRILGVTDLFEGLISCKYAQDQFPAKPDPSFYDLAMQLSGISEPQRHYFIDDSVLNVKGAQVHGWNAWHFDEDGTGQLPEGSVAGSVRSLQDLRSAWKQFVSQ